MMKQPQKEVLLYWNMIGIDEKKRLSKKYHNKIYHQLNYMEKKFIWKHELISSITISKDEGTFCDDCQKPYYTEKDGLWTFTCVCRRM